LTPLRLGTRGSRLALTQSRWVVDRLMARHPGLTVELVEIRTSGDVLRDVPLGPEHGQSFFTKEIEDALLRGEIDLAVHSCKDLATALPDGLVIAAIPGREDPRDVLVSGHGGLDALPEGASVGTSSPRRKGFLRAFRPDLDVRDQRGNVPTRIRAAEEGRVHAVVLAAAGLARLGLSAHASETLDPALMLPAAAQGALALQVRVDDTRTRALVGPIDDPDTHAAVTAERACLGGLQAGCQAPVGVLARVRGAELVIDAAVVTPDGIVRVEGDGATRAAADVGGRAAGTLLDRMGLASLVGVSWAGPPPRGSASSG